MQFTLDFIQMFFTALYYAGPLLLMLMLIIVILGYFIGKIEGWSKLDDHQHLH
jgi:hypothetical protein